MSSTFAATADALGIHPRMLRGLGLLLLLLPGQLSASPIASPRLLDEDQLISQTHSKIMMEQMMKSLGSIGKRSEAGTVHSVGQGLLHQVHLLDAIFKRQRSETKQNAMDELRDVLSEIGRR